MSFPELLGVTESWKELLSLHAPACGGFGAFFLSLSVPLMTPTCNPGEPHAGTTECPVRLRRAWREGASCLCPPAPIRCCPYTTPAIHASFHSALRPFPSSSPPGGAARLTGQVSLRRFADRSRTGFLPLVAVIPDHFLPLSEYDSIKRCAGPASEGNPVWLNG